MFLGKFYKFKKVTVRQFTNNTQIVVNNRWCYIGILSSSSSSSYVCHGVRPLVDPFRSHVSRSLFCHDSFCQLGNSVSLSWVVCHEAFCLHVVSSSSCISVVYLEPSHSGITVSSGMEEMPSLSKPVQRLKLATLPLDLPCSGPVTHSGEIFNYWQV